MNRRDFWKWLVGMVAAPTALLAAGKAKPKFPRYFVPNWSRFCFSGGTPDVLIALAENRVEGWCADGYPPVHFPTLRLADCERLVRDGIDREITAAEAEALLKTYRPSARRVGKHYDGLLYDDLYISNPMPCDAENTRKARAAYEKIFGHGVSP